VEKEGRKLAEFCERNMLEVLNGKHGENPQGEKLRSLIR
jgi:hypothetical protein